MPILRLSRKQALAVALLFAVVVNPFAPIVASADTIEVGQAFSFTTLGTSAWTVPAEVASIKVKVWGGGGAGGDGEKITESNRSGLGGGAGGYAEKTISVTPGDAFSITVGAGGQGIQSVENGRVGNSGSESRFEGNGHALVATGGTGGASYTGGGNPSEPIGQGGQASGGDVNENGGNGGGYSVDLDGNPYASSGGSAFNGGQGGERGRCGRDGHCPGSAPGSSLAQDGMIPGGGGGGADVAGGGYGAQGEVRIEIASLVVAPTNDAPKGWLDSVSCDSIRGWAYDPNNSSASVDVHFYTDGSGTSDRFIGVVRADQHRQDVNDAEGITGDHGFTFALPTELKDGQMHKIYAYGIDLTAGDTNNAELNGSPKEITCSGGGIVTPGVITGTITVNSPACVAPGTPMMFVANVTGTGVTSVVLEKDTNGDGSWGRVASFNDITGSFQHTSNEPSTYTGTYRLRLLVNGEVKDVKSVNVSANCGGTTPPQVPITASLTTTAGACAAAGTNVPFSVSVGGTGVTSVVLEKDTNGDGSWGQVRSWTGPVAALYTTEEPSTYTGTYRLRLIVNGEVRETRTVLFSTNCGGGGTTPGAITATLSTASPVCVALGTGVVFTASVSGATVNSVVLQKDTNGDGSWGDVASYTSAGTYTYTTNEPSTYSGAYKLRLLVNGEVRDIRTVTLSANCGVTTPVTSGTITTSAASCVAAGTNIPFAITIAGTGISSVVLEKDTNGDDSWGQVATYGGAGTFTFTSNESSSYTGPYTLRLRINGEIKATRTVQVSNNCGGTTTTEPITATLASSASCATPGAGIRFTATVAGTGVNTIVLEKDTNGDGSFGEVATFTGAGTHQFTSNEEASYSGTYVLRVVVNGTVMDTESVTVSSNCGGTTNPPTNTGGGGGGGGGGGRSGGPCFGYGCPTTTSVVTPTVPGDIWIILDGVPTTSSGGGNTVTGPEQVCASGNPIRTFLKIGLDNDPGEVSKLQRFLNKYEGANLVVNGVFDTATEAAVKNLQTNHASEILAPWGVSEPTGIVYLTTTRYINTTACGDADVIKDNTGVLNPTNPGDFEGEIGAATTSSDTANIAGIFGAIKDIPWYQILILLLLLIGGAFIIAASFQRSAPVEETYMSLIRGAAILAVGTVLNVLNTVSYILNPRWFVDKTGVSLPWLLGLDAVNLAAITVICLAVLISLYGRIVHSTRE